MPPQEKAPCTHFSFMKHACSKSPFVVFSHTSTCLIHLIMSLVYPGLSKCPVSCCVPCACPDALPLPYRPPPSPLAFLWPLFASNPPPPSGPNCLSIDPTKLHNQRLVVQRSSKGAAKLRSIFVKFGVHMISQIIYRR